MHKNWLFVPTKVVAKSNLKLSNMVERENSEDPQISSVVVEVQAERIGAKADKGKGKSPTK